MAAEQAANELFRPRAQKTDGQAVQMRPSLTHFQQVTRKLVRNKLAMVGFTLIVLMVVMAIVGPHLVPYSYSDQSLLTANQEISAEHWFGTDELGRDMFSRTWYGARISLIIGVTAALIDLVIGVTIGGIA